MLIGEELLPNDPCPRLLLLPPLKKCPPVLTSFGPHEDHHQLQRSCSSAEKRVSIVERGKRILVHLMARLQEKS
jgi:hypothetical protein